MRSIFIPLQQGLRQLRYRWCKSLRGSIFIPLQQGLRRFSEKLSVFLRDKVLSLFHYNKD